MINKLYATTIFPSQILFGCKLYADTATEIAATEANLQPNFNIFENAFQSGPIVSLVLITLVTMSILTWAIFIAKWIYLRKVEKNSQKFIKNFWDSRSLNDLNCRLAEYPYSPLREIFRNGYSELVRGSQLKEQAINEEIAINAAMDNLTRSLYKSRFGEKKYLERYLPVLAISASTCPFIGLFGTVWGIMGAFEGIAKTGSSSLATVAPGISEALIATAFGLAAAIPAVVGYNIAVNKIKGLLITMEGFGFDFLNIVERYLIADKPKSSNTNQSTQTPRI